MKIAGFNPSTGEGVVIEKVTMNNAYKTFEKAMKRVDLGNWSCAIGPDEATDLELLTEALNFSKVPLYKVGKD